MERCCAEAYVERKGSDCERCTETNKNGNIRVKTCIFKIIKDTKRSLDGR